MREHFIVCQFDERLMQRLNKKRIALVTNGFEEVHHICESFNDNGNSLHCLVIHHKGSVVSIPFHENWKNVPMAIFANELGPFKEIMAKLPMLREMNIRIFLSSDNKANFTSLHILASLGVDCGLSFGNNDVDWEALNDLMTYAIYSKVKHASVEPFLYAAKNYTPERLTDFSTVYFENPQHYLHIDKDENIALTSNDLKSGKFIAKGVEALDHIHENPLYKDAENAWQEFFLSENPCAYCQAWRICIGKFSKSFEKNPGCRQFFTDLMDAADFYHVAEEKKRKKEVWQP
jgi:hypothetical protein